MTDPTTPNPPQVQRGVAVLSTALRLSTLLPREHDAIFSILRTLNAADELLPRLAAQPGSDALAALQPKAAASGAASASAPPAFTCSPADLRQDPTSTGPRRADQ